nr:hypothetical protein [Tanacetum cinerariifolium]
MVKNLEAGVKFYMFPRFFQVFVNHKLSDMSHHKGIFVNPSLTKKVFANIKRVGTGFSRVITPLFETRMVQAPEEMGDIPTDTYDKPILTQPSSSQPQRKHKSRRKQRKETEAPHTEPQTEEHIPTPSYDPLPSGEDRMQLSELVEIRIKLSDMGKMNDEDLFRVNDLDGDEMIVDVIVGENVEQDATVAEKEVSATADEVVTAAESIEGITAATTPQISKDDVYVPQFVAQCEEPQFPSSASFWICASFGVERMMVE